MNSKDRLIYCFLGCCLGLCLGMLLELVNPTTKAEYKPKYTVTIYNKDGSIRGTYHNITQIEVGLKPYRSVQSYSSSVLYLPEYSVWINSDYVIIPEKD